MVSEEFFDPEGHPYPVMDMVVIRPGVRVFCRDRDEMHWDEAGRIIAARAVAERSWEFDVLFDGSSGSGGPVTMQDEQIWPVSDEEKNAPPPPDALGVFICHGKEDKEHARGIYRTLRAQHFAPWLDEENLAPGVEWEPAIRAAVRYSDVVLVCLSRTSSSKTGFVQKEIRIALDAAEERPEGLTYIIPAMLEKCDLPSRLGRWQAVELYKEQGMSRLLKALEDHPKRRDSGLSRGKRVYWRW
jgi:hypothetical protein